MIYRGITFKLEPTEAQATLFRQHAGVCRLVYNLCLEQRRDWWKRYQERTGDNLNFVTQARQLTILRAEFDFIRSVSQTAQQMAVRSLGSRPGFWLPILRRSIVCVERTKRDLISSASPPVN